MDNVFPKICTTKSLSSTNKHTYGISDFLCAGIIMWNCKIAYS